jgi:hypothetical protein
MAVVTVSFDGTRLNSSDSNSGWGNYNIGGGTPASEPANAYQQDTPGSTVGAVGKKVTSTTTRQGVDYNGAAVDYSGANVWFCKVYVADAFDLNATFGVEVSIGSGNTSNYHQYNIAGTSSVLHASSNTGVSKYGTYPSQGGYILMAIDPSAASWADAQNQSGTLNTASVVWYAVGAAFITGTAKAENVAMDAIDYGEGLLLVDGGGGDPDGEFNDFLEYDQNTKQNRYGVVYGSPGFINVNGKLKIGTAADPTVFTDNTSIVTFQHNAVDIDQQGVFPNINNASSVIEIGCTLIGAGQRTFFSNGPDSRPSFNVSGTSGRLTLSANLRAFQKIDLTSAVDVINADIQTDVFGSSGCHVRNSILRYTGNFSTGTTAGLIQTNSPSDFGTSSGYHDIEIIRSNGGAYGNPATAPNGPAITINALGTYTFTNITFTNWGADTTNNAAIWTPLTTGTITINVNGGSTPTVRTAGATVTVNNTKTVKVTVLDAITLNPIQGVRVLLEAGSGGPLAAGTDILSGLTDVNGVIEDNAFNYTADQPVTGKARKGTTSPLYQQGVITGTITTNGFDTTLLLISDE